MNIKDYIALNQIQTGDTKTYNSEVLDYFNVDTTDMTFLEVNEKVQELTKLSANDIKSNKLKVNGKWFMIEKDITKSKFGQFLELDSYLTDSNYLINHLNELLAIYVRPRKWDWLRFRWKIEKWDTERKEEISNDLLEMNISDAFGLNVFFYQSADNSIKNMKTHYLNQMMEKLNQMMK